MSFTYPPRHIVLLGDSILDNGAYTGKGPDVITQLKSMLGSQDQATLVARDGDVAEDIYKYQHKRVPATVTHLVLSVGGNDALAYLHMLDAPAQNASDVLMAFARAREAFEPDYRKAVEHLLPFDRALILCTIYNGNFPEPYQTLCTTALCFFNDVILRVALEYNLPVIDLRRVCNKPEHYANPIEPSSAGGERIVLEILERVAA